jgi:hypothetical protein
VIQNSKGKIYYGLHFYPGVAQYAEAGKEPYRVFLNEDTLRNMDPSFAGRPVFVEHVDGVHQDVDLLKGDADGWVIESFFNAADGKHWCKFLVCSDKAERAIKSGMRLSNCYLPKAYGPGGLWNGVPYSKEITGGEYEHLAIVPNPRYEESVILTPEAFKAYNEDKQIELKRLANEKGTQGMKLKFFKRTAVENAADLESMSVLLPKSGKEMTVAAMVNELDYSSASPVMANGDHLVDLGEEGGKMKVNELVEKYKNLCKPKETDMETFDNDETEDKEARDSALKLVEHEEKEIMEEKAKNEADEITTEGEPDLMDGAEDKAALKAADDAAKVQNEMEAKRKAKAEAKAKADKLRNAPDTVEMAPPVELSGDMVSRGKSRYGS